MTDQYKREQIAFPNQGRYFKEPRPARKIPTREQLEHDARRQALLEERGTGEPSTHHIGSSAGFHPEDDEELEEDERYYTTRQPTSTRRYQRIPDVTTGQGRVNVVEHYHQQPLRAHRQPPPQQPRQQHIYTDEVETTVPKGERQKRRTHPLLYLGVGMLAMLALFVLLSSALSWVQQKRDDLTYGRPRTYQIDAVVGHNDSLTNPSHFIAINLNRHVEVLEIPGQDTSKMKVYTITTLFGDGEDLTPVTLSFRDVNGDGKPDTLIHVEQQTLVLINDNGSFRPAKPGEVKGLL